MRSVKTLFLGLTGVWLLAVALSAQPADQLSASDRALREYLPGDIVHILIEAPLDTAKIGAVMPDGSEIQLGFDARSNLWHGYWEIPPGFKKGLYRARLIATDVGGYSFEGKTSAFRVTEPVLALLTRISSGENGEAPRLAHSRRAVFDLAVTPEVVPAARPVVARPKAKIAPVRRAALKAVRPKKMISVVTKGDSASKKAQLVAAVRAAMSQSDYETARRQLKALLKTDPKNKEMRTILNRLEVVVRAKGAGQ
jgi:hypothetical protein